MAEAKRYYWLKLKEDFFGSKRIKKLRHMAGGDTYLIIYLKLQLKAMKSNGLITYDGLEDNIADELALDLDENPDDVRATLIYLTGCGLAETSDDMSLFFPYAVENVGSENTSTQRVREYRERQKLLHCNAPVTQVKRPCNGEIEIDKDIELNIITHSVRNNNLSCDDTQQSESGEKKDEKYTAEVAEVIAHLNEAAKVHYKASTKDTRRHIIARLKEGYTVFDLCDVIDQKVEEWQGTPMAKYLRPKTLFSPSNFESYFNDPTDVRNRIAALKRQFEEKGETT